MAAKLGLFSPNASVNSISKAGSTATNNGLTTSFKSSSPKGGKEVDIKEIEKNKKLKVTMLGGKATIDQVMENRFQAPLDISTFLSFAKIQHCEEAVLFMIEVQEFKRRPAYKEYAGIQNNYQNPYDEHVTIR